MKEYNRMKLISMIKPSLTVGKYTVSARQEVTTPTQQAWSMQSSFTVGGRRFSLQPSELYSVYPGLNTDSDYSLTLPHIVFDSKTFLWRFKFGSGDKPWLALICFSSDEAPIVKEIKIADLKENGVFCPCNPPDEFCVEKETDICNAIDISFDMFSRIMPKETDISYLSHVKLVDLSEKEDNIICKEGYFCTLICNRFPKSSTKGQEPEKNTVHLVSLEGFENYLPEGNKVKELSAYDSIRLVSLYHWDFYSHTDEEYVGFETTIKNIDSSFFGINSKGAVNATVKNALDRGYVPLPHTVRTGEQTLSWYRPPLVPYVYNEKAFASAHTADGYLEYDGQSGMFDTSYAAAWQLGRLLALSDAATATNIYEWNRNLISQNHNAATRALLNEKIEGAEGESYHSRFARHSLASILEKIVTGNLVGTPSDPKEGKK